MANFMDTGNGYPSTATPFAMDLATPIMAITQQMVKRRKEEIATNKEIANNNEAMMLKALDFETVKGLSDGIQEEHVKAIDSLSEKWASRMAQVQGKLSSVDKLELIRDQKSMETDIANKKANVLMYEKLWEKIQDPKAHEYMDVDATRMAMAKWAQDGNVGKNALGLMKLREWTGSQIVMRDDGDMLKEVAKRYNEEMSNAAPGQIARIKETYGKRADEAARLVLSNKALHTPAQIADAERMVQTLLGDIYKDKYIGVRGGGKLSAKEKFTGNEGRYTSMVEVGRTGEGYIAQHGSPINVSATPTGENAPTAAKFMPLQLREDGIMEGTFTVTRERESDPMTQDQVDIFLENNRAKTVKPAPGDPKKSIVVYDDIQTWTGTIPYERERDVLSKRDPAMESYYQNLDASGNAARRKASQDSMKQIEDRIRKERLEKQAKGETVYPVETEMRISKFAEANDLSREEAIKILKDNKKL